MQPSWVFHVHEVQNLLKLQASHPYVPEGPETLTLEGTELKREPPGNLLNGIITLDWRNQMFVKFDRFDREDQVYANHRICLKWLLGIIKTKYSDWQVISIQHLTATANHNENTHFGKYLLKFVLFLSLYHKWTSENDVEPPLWDLYVRPNPGGSSQKHPLARIFIRLTTLGHQLIAKIEPNPLVKKVPWGFGSIWPNKVKTTSAPSSPSANIAAAVQLLSAASYASPSASSGSLSGSGASGENMEGVENGSGEMGGDGSGMQMDGSSGHFGSGSLPSPSTPGPSAPKKRKKNNPISASPLSSPSAGSSSLLPSPLSGSSSPSPSPSPVSLLTPIAPYPPPSRPAFPHIVPLVGSHSIYDYYMKVLAEVPKACDWLVQKLTDTEQQLQMAQKEKEILQLKLQHLELKNNQQAQATKKREKEVEVLNKELAKAKTGKKEDGEPEGDGAATPSPSSPSLTSSGAALAPLPSFSSSLTSSSSSPPPSAPLSCSSEKEKEGEKEDPKNGIPAPVLPPVVSPTSISHITNAVSTPPSLLHYPTSVLNNPK